MAVAGRKVVREQLDALDADHAADITAAMAEVRREGRRAAKHLRGDVWEVKADYKGLAYRVLFAEEGDEGQVCLALRAVQQEVAKDPAADDRARRAPAARLAQPRTRHRPLAISFLAYHC
jgi:phage-related protein